ncbi:MAG: hypothetical protein QW728_05420, partial [Thermoplasmata archaeon]
PLSFLQKETLGPANEKNVSPVRGPSGEQSGRISEVLDSKLMMLVSSTGAVVDKKLTDSYQREADSKDSKDSKLRTAKPVITHKLELIEPLPEYLQKLSILEARIKMIQNINESIAEGNNLVEICRKYDINVENEKSILFSIIKLKQQNSVDEAFVKAKEAVESLKGKLNAKCEAVIFSLRTQYESGTGKKEEILSADAFSSKINNMQQLKEQCRYEEFFSQYREIEQLLNKNKLASLQERLSKAQITAQFLSSIGVNVSSEAAMLEDAVLKLKASDDIGAEQFLKLAGAEVESKAKAAIDKKMMDVMLKNGGFLKSALEETERIKEVLTNLDIPVDNTKMIVHSIKNDVERFKGEVEKGLHCQQYPVIWNNIMEFEKKMEENKKEIIRRLTSVFECLLSFIVAKRLLSANIQPKEIVQPITLAVELNETKEALTILHSALDDILLSLSREAAGRITKLKDYAAAGQYIGVNTKAIEEKIPEIKSLSEKGRYLDFNNNIKSLENQLGKLVAEQINIKVSVIASEIALLEHKIKAGRALHTENNKDLKTDDAGQINSRISATKGLLEEIRMQLERGKPFDALEKFVEVAKTHHDLWQLNRLSSYIDLLSNCGVDASKEKDIAVYISGEISSGNFDNAKKLIKELEEKISTKKKELYADVQKRAEGLVETARQFSKKEQEAASLLVIVARSAVQNDDLDEIFSIIKKMNSMKKTLNPLFLEINKIEITLDYASVKGIDIKSMNEMIASAKEDINRGNDEEAVQKIKMVKTEIKRVFLNSISGEMDLLEKSLSSYCTYSDKLNRSFLLKQDGRKLIKTIEAGMQELFQKEKASIKNNIEQEHYKEAYEEVRKLDSLLGSECARVIEKYSALFGARYSELKEKNLVQEMPQVQKNAKLIEESFRAIKPSLQNGLTHIEDMMQLLLAESTEINYLIYDKLKRMYDGLDETLKRFSMLGIDTKEPFALLSTASEAISNKNYEEASKKLSQLSAQIKSLENEYISQMLTKGRSYKEMVKQRIVRSVSSGDGVYLHDFSLEISALEKAIENAEELKKCGDATRAISVISEAMDSLNSALRKSLKSNIEEKKSRILFLENLGISCDEIRAVLKEAEADIDSNNLQAAEIKLAKYPECLARAKNNFYKHVIAAIGKIKENASTLDRSIEAEASELINKMDLAVMNDDLEEAVKINEAAFSLEEKIELSRVQKIESKRQSAYNDMNQMLAQVENLVLFAANNTLEASG